MRSKSYSISLAAATLLLAGSSELAMAVPDLQFADFKSYRQTGNKRTTFQGGRFTVSLIDGFVVFAGCVGNGDVILMAPNIFCPLGTTGWVAFGDIDGDGLSDNNSFWSVSSVQAAQIVAPQQANLIELNSSPPSDLPRPLGGFRDFSVQVWYNMLQPPPTRFTITRYAMEKIYDPGGPGLRTQWSEIVTGDYLFKVPALPSVTGGETITQLPIKVTHHPLVEAWPGRGVVPTRSDWLLIDPHKWNTDQEIEMDPRLFNEFKWQGLNANTVFPSVDTITFSILDENDLIIFPPFDPATPPGDRAPELLPTPSDGIEIGPYLYSPGQRGVARIEVSRNLATSLVARDTSSRHFEWRVFFIDTYQGWAEALVPATFPSGTPKPQTKQNFDFDGDGWSNLEEFALQTDPADPASSPLIRPYRDADTNQIILEVGKRPFVGDSVDYQVEYSSDRIKWTLIRAGDPVYFIETDNADLLKVRSRTPSPPERNGFLRVKITQK